MKTKATLCALIATASVSTGATTINIRNFSAATVGVPIVTLTGAAQDQTTFFANPGYFSSSIDFAATTFTAIQSAFVSIDNSPLTGGSRSGLFTGQTFNGALPSGFFAKDAYIVVANNSNFASATLFAVFNAGVKFTTPDALGNSSQTLDGANVVFGTVRSVTTQPTGVTNANFTNGVVLVASQVPEPSSALLGAVGILGLLRRRRN